MKKSAKRTIALILSIVMAVGMMTVGVSAADVSEGFSDTANSPYSHMIDELAKAGIIKGIGNGKYGPNLSVSRAMAVTILGRMAGVEGVYTGSFSDVTADDYYAGYVGWAVDNGIILGDGKGHFMPDESVTGYELDLMLARYAKLVGIDYTAANQSDATLTRAEVAAMVYYIYVQMPDSDDPVTKEEVWCVNENAAILYGKGDANIYGEMYYPANFDPNKTYPIIVGSHGLGVTSSFYSMMWGETLAKAGCVVYAIDLCGGAPAAGRNGASKSDGEWLDMSILTEVDDVNAAVDFVKTLPYVDTNKVFLMGASQGGAVSALAAADRETRGLNDIAGAILLYPYLNVSKGLREAYSSKEDLPTEPTKWLTMQNDGQELGPRYFQDMYDVDVYERIAGFNGNVLIVQGLSDDIVPYTAAVKAITDSYPSQNAQLTLVAGDSSVHSFDIPFMGYTAGVDMAVSAVMESLSNWLTWGEAATEQPGTNPNPGDNGSDRPEYSSNNIIAKDVAYIDDVSNYHLLDVYDSVGADTKQPLVIEIHGGGLIGGTKETNEMHSDTYSKNGFKVVTPNYTLMPDGNYKTIVQDLFAMFDWVGQNAGEYNYNLDQVFLSGDSAGGYIVSLLAAVLNTPELQKYYEVTPPTDITFKGFILTCPMADQEDLVRALDGEQENFLNGMIFAPRIGADILKNEDIMSHAILFNIIDPETFPEVYIITTSDGGDPYYRDAVMLKDFLDENGIPYKYNDYHGIEHDLGHVFNIDNDKQDWIESKMANDGAIEYMLSLCK